MTKYSPSERALIKHRLSCAALPKRLQPQGIDPCILVRPSTKYLTYTRDNGQQTSISPGRAAYIIYNNIDELPDGTRIFKTCRNHHCINPHHITEKVTLHPAADTSLDELFNDVTQSLEQTYENAASAVIYTFSIALAKNQEDEFEQNASLLRKLGLPEEEDVNSLRIKYSTNSKAKKLIKDHWSHEKPADLFKFFQEEASVVNTYSSEKTPDFYDIIRELDQIQSACFAS